LADVASAELVGRLRHEREQERRAAVTELQQAERLAQQLDGQLVTVAAKASPSGTLYAAVTGGKISAALRAKGLAVSPEQVGNVHLKTAGEHEVAVTLPHGLEAKITVLVQPAPE
jgi:large subunit ribosomal protein L9